MPGITVTQACKSYETSHYTVKAVNHANLSVESGEAVAIVGPSGSGKSTLSEMPRSAILRRTSPCWTMKPYITTSESPCFTTGRSSAGSISPESGRSRRSWTYQTS